LNIKENENETLTDAVIAEYLRKIKNTPAHLGYIELDAYASIKKTNLKIYTQGEQPNTFIPRSQVIVTTEAVTKNNTKHLLWSGIENVATGHYDEITNVNEIEEEEEEETYDTTIKPKQLHAMDGKTNKYAETKIIKAQNLNRLESKIMDIEKERQTKKKKKNENEHTKRITLNSDPMMNGRAYNSARRKITNEQQIPDRVASKINSECPSDENAEEEGVLYDESPEIAPTKRVREKNEHNEPEKDKTEPKKKRRRQGPRPLKRKRAKEKRKKKEENNNQN